VLELAELATEAGVPPSVLTVLTGTGEDLGRALVTNPAVKKVDVTVRNYINCFGLLSNIL
jgi:acyl-CoA reductase-like NAD-dependent aldehyde dehydrogenase